MADAQDLTSRRLVPRVRIKPDRLLPILVAFSLLTHALVLLPLLLRDDPVSKPQEQEIPVELVREPPKPPEKKAGTPAPHSAAKPETKPETKPPEQKKAEEKPPEQKAPEQKPPQEKSKGKTQDQKRPEQKQPEPKPKAQNPPEQKSTEQKPPAPEPRQKVEQRQPPRKAAESPAERMRDLLGQPPPGLGAIALPGTSADGTIEVSYGQLVMSNVAKAKKQGRYEGTPGYTLVAFTLGDAGEVTSVVVREPSGSTVLDEEAVAMIKRGAPYPPPPPGAPRNFTVGLAFRPE